MIVIHLLDGQTDQLLHAITQKNVLSNVHKQSLKDYLETFDFRALADREKKYAADLTKLNRIIIPAEDEGYREFVIHFAEKYRDTEGLKVRVGSWASYLLLKKAKVIEPQSLETYTPNQLVGFSVNGTEWTTGKIEVSGIRTMRIGSHTNPFAFLKTIANEFDAELRFRTETDGNKVTGRYVDLLERVGQWQGREVTFGKDLENIRRKEDTSNIYTALFCLGPENSEGRRLETLVEDFDALQRWGRRDKHTGELQHLIGVYEPESTRQDMTMEELRQYGRTELNKRINAVVEYEANIIDLEHVPGMENKKIRFGDTIRIKDEKFNPPLYLEARIHTQERDIFVKSKKQVELGDFVEYTEEEVKEIWKSLQDEIKRSLARMLTVNIVSSAGDVFKNGEGNTELTAVVYAQGKETDQDGETYSYVWSKYDKLGNQDPDYRKEGKTITVQASEIDEKAIYACDVLFQDVAILGFTTLTNVYDGKEGEQGIPGPPGENGKTLYTWHKYADDDRGSGMSDNPQGKAYIGIAYNKESPIKSTNPNDYEWSKYIGDQGVPGPPGEDGQPNYTWVKYADDKDGNGMSDSPDDKRYLGLAYNKTSPNESSNPSDYSWSPLYDNVQVGGRNLLRGTQKEVKTIASSGWGDVSHPDGLDLLEKGVLQKGETYTFRVYLESDSYPVRCYVRIPNDSTPYRDFRGNSIPANSKGYSSVTFTVPDDAIDATAFVIRFDQRDTPTQQVGYGEEKLEKGNVATDWTPAPRDHAAYADRVSKEQAEKAREQAEAFAKNASNIKKGVIDVGSVPIRTAANGARIQWDGTNGLVQYDSDGNPVSWLDLKGNSRFVNAYLSGEIHAKRGVLGDGNVIIDDQGVKIVRPDGAIAMQNGLMHNAYAVSADDPYYMTTMKNEVPGADVGPVFIPGGLYGYKFRARSWYVCLKYSADGSMRKDTGYLDVRDGLNAVAFQRYEFVHCARYLIFHYWPHADSGKHSLHVVNGSSDKKEDRIYFQLIEKGTSGIQKCVIDLGKPTFKKRDVTFKIGWVAAWTPSPDEEIIFRMKSVIQTDVL